MKVSDQMKVVRLKTDVSRHRVFNALMMAVKTKLEDAVPGLQLSIGGKTVQGPEIAAVLSGTVVDEKGDAGDRVKLVVEAIKNQTAVDSLL